MDGSGHPFLCDPPYFSPMSEKAGGILYVDDFEFDRPDDRDTGSGIEIPQPARILTQADINAARTEGYQDGCRVTLSEASLLQSQLHSAAVQAVADALDNARVIQERAILRQAGDAMRLVLGILQAALPAVMAQHAPAEVDSIVRALAPGLACEPELRVRAHPETADMVRETLIACLQKDDVILCVTADAQLAAGDICLAWQDGQARRDTVSIWTQIRAALAPLELPSIEEICCANRR